MTTREKVMRIRKRVMIHLGATEKTTKSSIYYRQLWPQDDGFTLQRVNGDLFLVGGNPRGTLIGVYRLLEMLGVVFLAPNFDYYDRKGGAEFIPHKQTIQLDGKNLGVHRPAFPLRPKDVGEGGSHKLESMLALVDWMPKAGHNVFRCPSKATDPHFTSWDKWRATLIPELRKRGLLLQVGQHGFQNYLGTRRYYRNHPEWFGLIGNRRVTAEEAVFCTTNQEALKVFISNMMDYLSAHPELDIFDLWPPDNVPWCACPNCRAVGSESERYARLLALARRAMQQSAPKTRLGASAYMQYTDLPEETIIPSDVLLDFCPILREYEHRINDVVSSLNRTQYWKKLMRWLEHWKGEIQIYEYFTKYRFRSYPIVMPHLIAEELALYKTSNVSGISSYSEPDSWLAYEISHRMISRCSWDGIVRVEEELMRWATARVGSTQAKKLVEVIETLEGSLRRLYSAKYGFHTVCLGGKVTNKKQVVKCLQDLSRAHHLLGEIVTNLEGGSKEWVTQSIRSLEFTMADIGVQLSWDNKGEKLKRALKKYHRALQPSIDLDGVLHTCIEYSRDDLMSHYDAVPLRSHW